MFVIVCIRSTSWLVHTRSLQTGRIKCVESGRPVISTTVFADCGRLAKCVFYPFKRILLVHWNIGSDFHGQVFCVFVIDWALYFFSLSLHLFCSASVCLAHTATDTILRTTVISCIFATYSTNNSGQYHFTYQHLTSMHLYTVNSTGWGHSF